MIRDSIAMVRLSILLLLLPLALGCVKDGTISGEGKHALQNEKEKIAYSLGLQVGKDLQQEKVELNHESLFQGIRDGLQGSESLLSAEEMEQVRQAFVKERNAARLALAEKNRIEGENFLQKNALKQGVVTLPSGLQYRELEPGDGASPLPENDIKAHYVVRAIDGTEYENTRKSGHPAVFPVSGVLPAWTEALPLMKAGAKWELFVPAKLAYGERGVGNIIGPNQALIFEVEFIAIH